MNVTACTAQRAYYDYDKSLIRQMTTYMKLFYSPAILIIGLVGNGLIIALFSLSRRIKVTPNLRMLYLMIAIFDVGPVLFYHGALSFMGEGLRFAARDQGYNVRIEGWRASCKLLYFVLFFTEGTANGLVAFLAVERYVNIFHPFRTRLHHRRSMVLIACLVASYLAVNLPVLFVYDIPTESRLQQCLPTQTTGHNALLFSANLFNLPLPCFTMIVSNALCLLRLRRRRRRRARGASSRPFVTLLSQSRSLTVLFWLSGSFVLLILPCSIAHIVCQVTMNRLACELVAILYNLSGAIHSVNFFVYMYHMRSFRTQLLRCCTRTTAPLAVTSAAGASMGQSSSKSEFQLRERDGEQSV